MILLLVVPFLYLIKVFIDIKNIGIGWDTSVNLVKGEQVYRFLKTLDFSVFSSNSFTSLYFNEIPSYLNGHPTAFSFLSFLIGNFFSEIFEFHYYFFHIANICLTFLFLIILGFFVLKISKSYIYAIFSQIVILSHPFFYLHSVVNIKDLPVLVFSFIAIVFIFEKGLLKDRYLNYYFSLIFFILSVYSKFTAIFLLPLYFYLLYKFRLKFSLKVISVSAFIITCITLIFYPAIVFNFTEEIFRVVNVYLYLPSKAYNDVSFFYFLFINTPVGLLLIYLSTFSIFLFNKRFIFIFIIWLLPAFFYLIFINRQYDALRQFLFILVPFSVFSFLFFEKIKIYLTPFFVNLILVFSIIYFLFLFYLPVNQKIFYKNFFNIEAVNDGWGISIPIALKYVRSNYLGGRLYYSPANFLLEYYPIDKFEIIYQPEYSDIWIAARKTSSYVEEARVREQYYKLDENFDISNGMLEIWVKK